MKLNCDMGESYGLWTMGNDDAAMPWIDMANIACGFHASDPDIMANTIRSALTHNVSIGAHPGYQDKEGFGRRSIPHSSDSITHLVSYQVGALDALCQTYGTHIRYVKPHGALYNDMMSDPGVFTAILKGVANLSGKPALMILAHPDNDTYKAMARQHKVALLFEAFADRTYTDEGFLVPRSQTDAVHHDPETILRQARQIAAGTITTISGHSLPLAADTLCVHGDNPESIALIKQLRTVLNP